MSLDNPIRGVLFLYLSSIGGMALGYVYWILLARATTPEVVGIGSAALSIVALCLTIADLGIAYGLQRFLGKMARIGNLMEFRGYLSAALKILLVSTSLVIAVVIALFGPLQTFLATPASTVLILMAVVSVANFVPPLQFSLVSMMRTDYLAGISLFSGMAKIVVGLAFVLSGFGADGILVGVLSMYIADLVLCAAAVRHLAAVSDDNQQSTTSWRKKVHDLVQSGMAAYIPGTIQTVGTKIGVLAVFGSIGAIETGFYYMAFQIFAVVVMIPNTIMNILYPYASGLIKGRAAVMRKGIRLALIVSMPIVLSILLYTDVPLLLFGQQYTDAARILQLLIVSVPFVGMIGGISSLFYARGDYRYVLGIGLTLNLPRLIGYFVLSPLLGGFGAALSFTAGSVIGLTGAILLSRRISFELETRRLATISAVPIVLSIPMELIGIPWFVGVPIVIIGSTLAFTRLGLLARGEVDKAIEMLLPSSFLERWGPHMTRILDALFG